LYTHYFYEGKDECRPPGVSASAWPISKLLDECPELHNEDRMLAADNWFSGAQALQVCRNRGVHFVGTCKTNRLSTVTPKRPVGFPKAGFFKGDGAHPPERGDTICHRSTSQDETDYVTAWQDKRRVVMLSSYQPKMGVCQRKIKEGRVWTLQTLPRPNVVAHYNACMSGTDIHDMRLAFMRSTIKSNRWQPRVFTDMFASCMMNAFVLKRFARKDKKRFTEFDFIAEYLKEVCPPPVAPLDQVAPEEKHPAYDPKTKKARRVKAGFWRTPEGTRWRLSGRDHWSQSANNVFPILSDRLNDDNEPIRYNLRRNCRVCNTPTVYFCTKCETPVCIGACFIAFHTKSKLGKLPRSVRSIGKPRRSIRK